MILGLRSLTLRRAGAVSWSTAGRPTSTTTSSTIRGSWQPANGQDMKLLPEGTRQTDTRKVFTVTALRTEDQHGGTQADAISPDGSTWYQVQQVTPYLPEHPIPHYEALCVRLREAG